MANGSAALTTSVQQGFAKGKPIYVGIDVHKKDWTVHVLCQGEELYHSTSNDAH